MARAFRTSTTVRAATAVLHPDAVSTGASVLSSSGTGLHVRAAASLAACLSAPPNAPWSVGRKNGTDGGLKSDPGLAFHPGACARYSVPGSFFLRQTRRPETDGRKLLERHLRTSSVVENHRLQGGRVVQRHVLYLGEISPSQAAAWRKSIEVFDEEAGQARTLALFPEDRCAADNGLFRDRSSRAARVPAGPRFSPRSRHCSPHHGVRKLRGSNVTRTVLIEANRHSWRNPKSPAASSRQGTRLPLDQQRILALGNGGLFTGCFA